MSSIPGGWRGVRKNPSCAIFELNIEVRGLGNRWKKSSGDRMANPLNGDSVRPVRFSKKKKGSGGRGACPTVRA